MNQRPHPLNAIKPLLALLAVLLLSALAALAGDPVAKTWDYADLGDTPFSAANGNAAAVRVSPEVQAPGRRGALAVTLTTLNPAANAWDVQLSFLYQGGLQAWREYEISFLCKSSVPGTIRLAAAQAGRPHEELPDANLAVAVSEDWRPVTLTFTAKRDWTEPLALPPPDVRQVWPPRHRLPRAGHPAGAAQNAAAGAKQGVESCS